MALLFSRAWRDDRARRRKAEQVVAALQVEPADDDVAWLADAAANGDEDHARWELRYARTAIGLLVTQRDALDDRTVAEVSAALGDVMERDARIAEERRALAERQLNERLAAYREAMQLRGGPVSAADALGRCLLAFASDGARTAGAPLAYAIELLERYADEISAALRSAYGEAQLPEDVPPSVLRAP
jgi:hypothetical protein